MLVAVAVLALGGAGTIGALYLTSRTTPVPVASPTCEVVGVNGCTTKQGNGGGPAYWSPGALPQNSPFGPSLPADIQQACDLNARMRATSDDLTTQGQTIDRIEALAGTSAIFDVRFAANMLKDQYDLAAAVKRSGGDTFSTSMNLVTASIDLSTACIKAGWRP